MNFGLIPWSHLFCCSAEIRRSGSLWATEKCGSHLKEIFGGPVLVCARAPNRFSHSDRLLYTLSPSTMEQPRQKTPFSFLQHQELKLLSLSVTLSGACLRHCCVSDLCEHPSPARYLTSAFTSLTDTCWPLIFRAPYPPRQSWSFPNFLDECEDESYSLTPLYLYKVFEFLSHCSGSRSWGLGFSPPTLLVQCWQTHRARLYKPKFVHLFFNLWLLRRSFTNNLHRISFLAFLLNLEVLHVAQLSQTCFFPFSPSDSKLHGLHIAFILHFNFI